MNTTAPMSFDAALKQAAAAHAAGFAIFQVQLLLRDAGVVAADSARIIEQVFGVKKKPLSVREQTAALALRRALNASIGI